jgi:hypothetical protein
MSELTRSIIRGFGGQIGRNFANSTRRRSSNGVGRPAKSELDKALSYPIGGRVNTMIGKQFTLIQEFENHVSEMDSISDYNTIGLAYNKTNEKFNDTCNYINMVGDTPEQHEQSTQMGNMLNDIMKSKLQTIVNSMFNPNNISEVTSNKGDIENVISTSKMFNIEVNSTQTQSLIKKVKIQSIKNTVVGFLVWVFIFASVGSCITLSLKS